MNRATGGLKGIAGRLTALSWLIATVTLIIFVTAIIPQQKQDLLDALRSKAHGISSSLQEVTASAAVTEDYSSVVDQCIQALAGDEAIEYLVITKSDGLSVIVDRGGWRSEKLDSSWRPPQRDPVSSVGKAPASARRVFRYGRPFDYSGLQWGWIHVGLSLDAYDRSVSNIYLRTTLIAVLCVGLSLLASVWYARRMVRPICDLRAVLQRVAEGDLEVRADIRSQDELGSLGESFNRTADSLRQRNQVLGSVRYAAQQLLAASDWIAVLPAILERTARAAGVHRAFVLQVSDREQETPQYELKAVWGTAPGPLRPEWAGPLRDGRLVAPDRECLEAGVQARILLPVPSESAWWGVLGFDDCELHRNWSDAERDTFQALAGMLGATIGRAAAQRALVLANETLEARVEERTRELQEQVNAKERARAELAVAQQRLMDLSRQAGMAEIATSVLHNVGNVLNSLNTSASLVAAKVQESRVDKLLALIGMMQQHEGSLQDYLANDPKGQRVLPYLVNLGSHMKQEREAILRELNLVNDHVAHIKRIVTTQQNYATMAGLVEDLSLGDLVEDALRITEAGMARHRIHVTRDYEPVERVHADKHQILQILLNLLRNAKRAILDADRQERLILIRIRAHGHDRVRLTVKDSGVGLPKDHLTRVFAHGFTTKHDGHGFGLHSSALAARQMGGSLWAESDGPGLGASFTLELPHHAAAPAKGTS